MGVLIKIRKLRVSAIGFSSYKVMYHEISHVTQGAYYTTAQQSSSPNVQQTVSHKFTLWQNSKKSNSNTPPLLPPPYQGPSSNIPCHELVIGSSIVNCSMP